jgi:pimeloyl-ACP methyl ester carboxylesterase
LDKIYLRDWQATISYTRTVGEGNRLLLFLHGLSSTSSDFREIMRTPAFTEYNTVAPDLLGFGASDHPKKFDYSIEHHAECLVELIDELGFDNIVLVGHGMGGTIAIRVSNLRADRVVGLIVAEPVLTETERGYEKRFLAYTEEELEKHFPRLIRELSVKGDIEPDLAYWSRSLKTAEPRAVYRSVQSLYAVTADPGFKKVFATTRLPRYYLIGENSEPRSVLPLLEENGVTIHTVPGCGHAMIQSNPAAFAEAVTKCLKEIDF